MQAGRELDALVAHKVFGLFPCPHWSRDIYDSRSWNSDNCDCKPWSKSYDAEYPDFKPYSTNIAAAWEVVEKLDRRFWPEIRRIDDGSWCCEIVGRGDTPAQVSPGPLALEYAPTAPLAICLAALKAVGVEAVAE
jgi:hypothetical protein